MNFVCLPQSKDENTLFVLNKWYRKKGDHVKVGDAVACYEDDKSVVDIVSEFSGTITETFAAEGEVVPAGSRICQID